LQAGWRKLKLYGGQALVLQRPVGGRWVRCECGGVPWMVVAYN